VWSQEPAALGFRPARLSQFRSFPLLSFFRRPPRTSCGRSPLPRRSYRSFEHGLFSSGERYLSILPLNCRYFRVSPVTSMFSFFDRLPTPPFHPSPGLMIKSNYLTLFFCQFSTHSPVDQLVLPSETTGRFLYLFSPRLLDCSPLFSLFSQFHENFSVKFLTSFFGHGLLFLLRLIFSSLQEVTMLYGLISWISTG